METTDHQRANGTRDSVSDPPEATVASHERRAADPKTVRQPETPENHSLGILDHRAAPYVVLGLVLLLAAFLRLWRINSLFHFMGDEGTQSQAIWRLIHGHPPLLGPSLSIGAMHLGPLFYYLEAIPMLISGGSPVGPTVFVAMLGILAVALLFVYLEPSVGPWAAVGASAAMAVSLLMVEYSRRPWNPTPTPFFTLLFLYSLIAWKRRSEWWLLSAGASLACLLQLQPVNVFLVAVFVIFIVWARPQRASAIVFGLTLAACLLISSPLIIYDLGHSLANTHAWIDAFIPGHGGVARPSDASSPRLLFSLFSRAFGLQDVEVTFGLTVLAVAAAVCATLTDHEPGETNWELALPLTLLGVAAVGFEVYRHLVFEQYMVCLFVIPFICLGALFRCLSRFKLRGSAIAIVVALLIVSGSHTWTNTFLYPSSTVADASIIQNDLQTDDTYGHVQQVADRIVRWARGRTFNIRMATYLNTDAGYRYVLAREGQEPKAAKLTYVLIEPADWPQFEWPGWAQSAYGTEQRRETIGDLILLQTDS